MVHISTNAVDLIEEDRRKKGIPWSQGVRIFTEGQDLQMTYVDDPENQDRTVEQYGAEFYLAPEVAKALQGVTIDAVDLDPPQLVFRRDQPPAVLHSREAPEEEEKADE